MKLTGDLNKITSKRNSKNDQISLQLDKIEYISQKKDGRYFQTFNFEEELETPLIITGDCLARKNQSHSEEGEYEFQVYDKSGDEYVLNENKHLEVILSYDFDEDLTILTSVYYEITLPYAEFEELKKTREKIKSFQNRKSRKR